MAIFRMYFSPKKEEICIKINKNTQKSKKKTSNFWNYSLLKIFYTMQLAKSYKNILGRTNG